MKYLKQKDKQNRIGFKNFEYKKLIVKTLITNTNLSKVVRWKFSKELIVLPKKFLLSSFNNRCVITGRKKRINKLYSFSRIMFLRLAREGKLNNLKKATW